MSCDGCMERRQLILKALHALRSGNTDDFTACARRIAETSVEDARLLLKFAGLKK